ncbi:hypothetical protein [Bradyrhizobium sp. SZCCHNS3004]|uniref:hypothetical protein n=1 Tax=Bradyrhizobium sp. SZCCHNS3004 TaxID=3057312 RepID=UPI002916D0B7|nr:hypothetical protein [Bradyrhizobium sp. SZCCHNS3004]
MNQVDRKARTERAKELGRAAYRHGRDGEIVGYLTSEGEEKCLLDYRRGRVVIELWQPKGPNAIEAEFSRLRVRYDGRVEFALQWSPAGLFKVVKLERGDCESELLARARSD